MGGIVIWGLHRDTVDMLAIGLALFSLGSIPTGPLSVAARPEGALESARVAEWTVTRDDLVLGDEDGVLFIPADRADEILAHAEAIRQTEGRQGDRIRSGTSLREQVQFKRYLDRRLEEPGLTFREHLRTVGGEIEV
jgi:regulator of RNase E activity RraA